MIQIGVSTQPWDLHKEGNKDAARHQEKLKDAFRKRLTDIISQEDIITGDIKKVKVPIKSLDQYHFVFDPKKTKHSGQGDGNTKEGDVVGRERKPGESGDDAGDADGEEYYEAEIDIDDLVEMMLEDLGLPKLDPKRSTQITSPETVWNQIAKRGPLSNIHKKRTVIENIKRNAQVNKQAYVGDFTEDDLRYRSWQLEERPITSAVVIAMMDVSGSMSENKKYIARSFFFWMTQFLRKKYEQVEIVFITHTASAKVVSEHDFFYTGESGGTVCSSAYEKALEVIKLGYDPSEWNIFAFHFSDGDTFASDVEHCKEAIGKLCTKCNMVGYGEIRLDEYGSWYNQGAFQQTTLYDYYESFIAAPNFVKAKIESKDGIWPTLQQFFGSELDQ